MAFTIYCSSTDDDLQRAHGDVVRTYSNLSNSMQTGRLKISEVTTVVLSAVNAPSTCTYRAILDLIHVTSEILTGR